MELFFGWWYGLFGDDYGAGMEFEVDVRVVYAPLDEDHVEAWREAMRILLGWLLEVDPEEGA